MYGYINVTLRSLSIHASLSKAQAIWCPLSECFYLAFLDKGPELLCVGGQTFTAKVRSQQHRFQHGVNHISTCHASFYHLFIFTNCILRCTRTQASTGSSSNLIYISISCMLLSGKNIPILHVIKNKQVV